MKKSIAITILAVLAMAGVGQRIRALEPLLLPPELTYQTNVSITVATSSSLKTNVSYGDNTTTKQVMKQYGDTMSFSTVEVPATERWWITNVSQTHVLRFNWRGKERVVSEVEPISSNTNFQVMRAEWIATNDVPTNQKGFTTGTIWYTNLLDTIIIRP